MAKDKAAMIYKGNGFYVNIPARDLSAEEVERFGREFLLSLGLYEEVEQPKPKLSNKAMLKAEDNDEEVEQWQE